jgi:hypothetical protein
VLNHAFYYPLSGLAMQGMLAAAIAEFLELQAIRVVAPILFAGVVPLFTLGASQVNDLANVLLGHDILSFLGVGAGGRPPLQHVDRSS